MCGLGASSPNECAQYAPDDASSQDAMGRKCGQIKGLCNIADDNLIPRLSTKWQWLSVGLAGHNAGKRRPDPCFTIQIRHPSPHNQPFHPGRIVDQPRKLGPVRPRADDRCALGTSPRRDRLDLMNRKRVMVAKPEIALDASTMRCHIRNKRLRARERRRQDCGYQVVSGVSSAIRL